jgi:signal transduction histidine kinase
VRVQLSQLIQREIENFSQKGLVLPGQILAEVDHKFMFYTDPVLMREMLHHLLQNCIDFQKQDTPLQASVQVKAEGSILSIIISDNGMGILEEEAQKRAFEIFYVGSQASRGPGLGLYESMLIADKLKGRIQLLHTSEEGTQMLVVLPIFNKYTVPSTPPKNEVKV